jgi:hypothetical protein
MFRFQVQGTSLTSPFNIERVYGSIPLNRPEPE